MTFKDICSDLCETIDTLLEQRLTTEIVCRLIEEGYTHTMIAKELGVTKVTFWRWVDSDPERRQRVNAAEALASAAVEELRRISREQRRFEETKRQALAFRERWFAQRQADKG